MVFCIVAMVVFGILGIFSAKYRRYARESFRCVGRMATLRPCDTQFDQEMKSKITAKIMPRSHKLASFVYKNFTKLSWIFVIILFVSLGYTAYSVFNLVTTGTCDPAHPEQCVFNPQNPNTVQCPFDSFNATSGIPTIGGFSDIKTASIEQGTINGKVLVYYLGTTWCPHCIWEKPRFVSATSKFGNWTGVKEGDLSEASFQSNYLAVRAIEIDKIDVTKYAQDLEVFHHYSAQGTIPVIIIGGKYYRIGSGEKIGTIEDEKVLTALLCRATNNAVAECLSPEITALTAQLD